MVRGYSGRHYSDDLVNARFYNTPDNGATSDGGPITSAKPYLASSGDVLYITPGKGDKAPSLKMPEPYVVPTLQTLKDAGKIPPVPAELEKIVAEFLASNSKK